MTVVRERPPLFGSPQDTPYCNEKDIDGAFFDFLFVKRERFPNHDRSDRGGDRAHVVNIEAEVSRGPAREINTQNT